MEYIVLVYLFKKKKKVLNSHCFEIDFFLVIDLYKITTCTTETNEKSLSVCLCVSMRNQCDV